ncbi:uncharacterized protein LOC110765731 [Prunus avium]|uniref:Uncharacterized protein LOC110765731 n=1 Tax=Prunus avium TaxID=42229 RepID=A0A6P5TC05_PRUAV|nr:uncharacterized protein LOC110765731 [Prunus avium]
MASERNFEYTGVLNNGIALAAVANPEVQNRSGRTKFQTVSEQVGTLKQTISIPEAGYVTLKPQKQSAQMEAQMEVPVTEPQTETDGKPTSTSNWQAWKDSDQHKRTRRRSGSSVIKMK